MRMIRGFSRLRILAAVFAGAILGYGFLHPYSMVIYRLSSHHGSAPTPSGFLRPAWEAFDVEMALMGLPFALLGAAGGLFAGFWMEANRRKIEAEKRVAAMETLRQVMVTLAHHLLNAAQVVGGFANRLLRKTEDEGVRQSLRTIREEALRIEAVVESLRSLQSIAAERYAGGGDTLMIDIQQELRDRLTHVAQETAPDRQNRMPDRTKT